MLHHVLIVFGSSYGHTATIAAGMQRALAEDGITASIVDAAHRPHAIDPSSFDGVIVGASVIGGKHNRAVEAFIKRHRETLTRLPSAFYSVSGSAASADPRRRSDARLLMERFLTKLHWDPDLLTTFGGAIVFTRYSFLLRWVMKQIARRNGEPTDTSRDHDLTNWNHVEEFAHRFAHLVAPTTLVASHAVGIS